MLSLHSIADIKPSTSELIELHKILKELIDV
jgi:hypothetical protein